jgi:hypothetical protein
MAEMGLPAVFHCPITADQIVRRTVVFEFGRGFAFNSGTIRWASTLPSSTPHWSNESMFQIAPCVKTLCS